MSETRPVVDHFSTRTGGGAGAGARRLHEALLADGVDSRFWYWRRGAPIPPNSRRIVLWGDGSLPGRLADRIAGRVRRHAIKARLRDARRGAPAGLELFSSPVVGWATPYSRRRFRGHVAHLHWVAGLIDLPTFFRSLPRDHPVVWTLRDMNPFTGGCHFSGGCRRFTGACGSCPQLGGDDARDLSSEFLATKRTALRGINLHVVAPSRWMLERARNSAVLGDARSFHWIPTGIETGVFRPMNRTQARRSLGLPSGGLLVALGADRLDNERKGLGPALESLRRLSTDRDVGLLVFGDGLTEIARPPGLPVHAVGYVTEPERLASVFAAADCFLLPSLEDNLPKTGLEALSCGTPVVGFAAGGVPDFVVPHQTGLLAAVGDVEALARHIGWMLAHDDDRARMGQAARALVLERFDARNQVRAYRDLYEDLVPGTTGG